MDRLPIVYIPIYTISDPALLQQNLENSLHEYADLLSKCFEALSEEKKEKILTVVRNQSKIMLDHFGKLAQNEMTSKIKLPDMAVTIVVQKKV